MAIEAGEVRQEFRRARWWASVRSLSVDQKDALIHAEQYIIAGHFELAAVELRSLRASGADWSSLRC